MTNPIHLVEFEVMETWARMNSFAKSFAEIAEDSFESYLVAKENYIPMPDNEDPSAHFISEKELYEASFKTIVFAAMACEAAIFDLAAIQLGDDYVDKYVDKLNLVSKWVVIPKLICGKSMNIKGPALNSLKELTYARNALVHLKSLPIRSANNSVEKAEKHIGKIINSTENAYKTIVLLSLELNRLLGTPAGVLPFYEARTEIDGFSESSNRSESLIKIINRCRQIDSRASSE
ncbi:hypothetical protein [Pseudoalteromonas gelatinilytica]|uniref:Uncharacterized protein n=1 Tax=Pseudoalteromonas gelatinilytica TaxID=1703256 RepID=A0A3A3EMF3_9GAMM|nr:hypothetical protein [Pseudoalteromonas profundi]RJF37540.1 hypothetical protein D4741_05565 [Pseudoalteromonas profundi]